MSLKGTKLRMLSNRTGIVVYPDGTPTFEDYRAFRKAILNNEVPVYSPIGFRISSPVPLKTDYVKQKLINRHSACLDSQIDLCNRLAKIIFSPAKELKKLESFESHIYTIGAQVVNGTLEGCEPCDTNFILNKNHHLFTSIDTMFLHLYVKKGTGFSDMTSSGKYIKEELSKKISFNTNKDDLKYFPMNTLFTLSECVRVLPFIKGKSKEVMFTVEEGVDFMGLERIWNNYASI